MSDGAIACRSNGRTLLSDKKLCHEFTPKAIQIPAT